MESESHSRTTVFAPRIAELIQDHTGQDLFRFDHTTIAITEPKIAHRVFSARLAAESERAMANQSLLGRRISRNELSAMLRLIGRDVRTALAAPLPDGIGLSGPWPSTGHRFLAHLITGSDPRRLRILTCPGRQRTPRLTRQLIAASAATRVPPGTGRSAIAGLVTDAVGFHERQNATGMYLRAVGAVCVSVSALVANALWLGSPFDDDVPNSNILHEALRLLPPAWALQRHASAPYPVIDARIGKDDNVVILPLLMHRDPALWEMPDVFSPRRWDTSNPETAVGYLPFGHASELCWARHLVMPLADHLLTLVRRDGLMVDPQQKTAYVPLHPVLGVRKVRLVPKR